MKKPKQPKPCPSCKNSEYLEKTDAGMLCLACGYMPPAKEKKPKKEKPPKPPKPPKEPKPPKPPKIEKTEREIVEGYAKKVIDGKIARGHYDKRFEWHKRLKGNTSKDIWIDNDFYFSVVFQSGEQKYQFLKEFAERLGVEILETEQVKIVNGLELAAKMNIAIKSESALPYPYGDLSLRQFTLDAEYFDENDNTDNPDNNPIGEDENG